jgi:hypothetical protein
VFEVTLSQSSFDHVAPIKMGRQTQGRKHQKPHFNGAPWGFALTQNPHNGCNGKEHVDPIAFAVDKKLPHFFESNFLLYRKFRCSAKGDSIGYGHNSPSGIFVAEVLPILWIWESDFEDLTTAPSASHSVLLTQTPAP